MNEASPAGTLGAYATREAERYGIECLLNCVLREVALPRGEARLDYRGGDCRGADRGAWRSAR